MTEKRYTREQVKKIFAPHFCEAPLEQLLDLLDFETTAKPEQSEFVEKWANSKFPLTPTGQAQLIEEEIARQVNNLKAEVCIELGPRKRGNL